MSVQEISGVETLVSVEHDRRGCRFSSLLSTCMWAAEGS